MNRTRTITILSVAAIAGVTAAVFLFAMRGEAPSGVPVPDAEEHSADEVSATARTRIPRSTAEASGVRVARAGTATIVETVELTGTIQTDPARVSMVRPRFPGVVTEVRRTLGNTVERGDSLALVETNESLRSVSVDAPIGGLIVERNVQVGQFAGSEPLFVIADLSEVWAQLDVFGRDVGRVRAGQRVRITPLDGAEIAGTIDWISPLVAHGSQSVTARVILRNAGGELRPGQFVRADVVVDELDAEVAVERDAMQLMDGEDVVFVRNGDVYEARVVDLGRADRGHVEVLRGLEGGELYVNAGSYLIKADIEKSGASHEH